MPHIVINMYPGRSHELKKNIAEAMKEQFCRLSDIAPGSVSAAVKEIAPDQFEKYVTETYKGQEILAESDYIRAKND